MHVLEIGNTGTPERRRAGDASADSRNFDLAAKEFLSRKTGSNRRLSDKVARLLDRTAPLKDASHAEVESYGVDIPMRYASLYAVLKDGRKVRLRDSRDFAGWSGWSRNRSYLVRTADKLIEIVTDPEHPQGAAAPGKVRDLVFAATGKFIAPDGSQLVLPA